jgi:pyruvate/2-oxoglutarate dehydrogenase complex dihydrolipoamide dehydrogenase (E3) component
VIPWCTYTDPEVAHVGMYPKDAEAKGIAVDSHVLKLEDVDRAILDGAEDGLLKLHTRKGTGEILGATLVARHAGEMISQLTLAIVNKIGLAKFSKVIHPYPTQAEVFRKVADSFNRKRLTPLAKTLLTKWLAWTR